MVHACGDQRAQQHQQPGKGAVQCFRIGLSLFTHLLLSIPAKKIEFAQKQREFLIIINPVYCQVGTDFYSLCAQGTLHQQSVKPFASAQCMPFGAATPATATFLAVALWCR
jgi:hypothetical protein